MPVRTTVPTSYRAVIATVRPPIKALTRQDWSGGEHLPREGGFIVAANHVSEIDPFVLAHFLVDHGAPPLFLAKASLFEIPVLGRAIRALGQLPVYRGTSRAGDALVAAEEAIQSGACVVILPEGTLTRDPDLWPMRAKTGVGRLALTTGAPVVPVAQWGPQQLLPPYSRRTYGLFSRVTMHVRAGAPVGLSDLAGRADDPRALRTATDRVMASVTTLLATLRREPAPTTPYDPTRPQGAGEGSA